MKTNVSIKFNSIEEYREIEKKLIELGYKSAKGWNNAVIQIHKKGFVNIEDKLFYLDSTQIYRTLYNSLQEFLNDNAKTH